MKAPVEQVLPQVEAGDGEVAEPLVMAFHPRHIPVDDGAHTPELQVSTTPALMSRPAPPPPVSQPRPRPPPYRHIPSHRAVASPARPHHKIRPSLAATSGLCIGRESEELRRPDSGPRAQASSWPWPGTRAPGGSAKPASGRGGVEGGASRDQGLATRGWGTATGGDS